MASHGKVLIIDDEESLRIACEQTLELDGFSVSTAANGLAGIELARRESFHVVLLDLRMPGMYGMEVLQKLRQESPNAMVIVITGYATIESAVKAIKQGAYDYLPKPFTPEALTALVNKAASAARRTLESDCIGQEVERRMPVRSARRPF